MTVTLTVPPTVTAGGRPLDVAAARRRHARRDRVPRRARLLPARPRRRQARRSAKQVNAPPEPQHSPKPSPTFAQTVANIRPNLRRLSPKPSPTFAQTFAEPEPQPQPQPSPSPSPWLSPSPSPSPSPGCLETGGMAAPCSPSTSTDRAAASTTRPSRRSSSHSR